MKLRKLASMACATVVISMSQMTATATTARADYGDTIFNSSTLYLTSRPTSTMHTVCTTRRVFLAQAYDYEWSQFVKRNDADGGATYIHTVSKPVTIWSDNFKWVVCLNPRAGYYLMSSTLDPDSPTKSPIYFSTTLRVTNSGSHTYGDQLDPPFG